MNKSSVRPPPSRSVLQAGLICLLATMTGCMTTDSTQQQTTSISGRVTKIHDGDSIHITPAGQKRQVIRLAGIDAPELKQDSGYASRDKLRSMLTGQNARADCHKKDKYQRNVCRVFLGQLNIGLKMVETGHAWHYTKYQSEQSSSDRKRYKRAEKNARQSALGLWGNPNRVAPWDFRNNQ